MIQQIIRSLGVLATLALFLLAGCDGSSTLTSTNQSGLTKAATGEVTISVQFPQAALQKALIDERTTSIQIVANDLNWNPIANVTLTPDPVTGMATTTLSIPIGNVEFTAWAYMSVPDPYSPGLFMDQEIEMVSTAGDIIEGNNTVILNFLTGDWQFVDANDNPISMSLGGTGYNASLSGFSLSSGHMGGYAAKAGTIDPTKPHGWGNYAMQWFQTATTPYGPSLWAGQTSQFVSTTGNANTFGADWLNLTNTDRSEQDNHYYYNYNDISYVAGDRLIFMLDSGPDGGDEIIVDGQGNDVTTVIDGVATSQVIDGSTLAGNLLELTFVSETSIQQQSQIDCQPYWNSYSSGAAAHAAAIKSGYTQSISKAAIGDATPLLTDLSVSYNECQEGTDIDGDNDYLQEYLIVDANLDGLYDPATDTFNDIDMDGVFDQTNFNWIDGDGDGDYNNDWLSYDANNNGRYDAGDTFTDYDNDGVFDYTYNAGDLYQVTETFSDLVTREYRAKGSQLISKFTPSMIGSWSFNSNGVDPVVITFLDESRYIHAEDGIADATGGPGMEYGSYSINTSTGIITFTATYDTTGDWGPAETGTGTINLQINTANQVTISSTDPLDPWSADLNRVTPDFVPFIGTWTFGSELVGMQVITLLPNYEYMVASFSPLDNTLNGMERGNYSVNPMGGGNGSLYADITFTGISGTTPIANTVVTEPGTVVTIPVSLSNNGNTLTFSDGQTPVAFARVK